VDIDNLGKNLRSSELIRLEILIVASFNWLDGKSKKIEAVFAIWRWVLVLRNTLYGLSITLW